MTTHDTIEGIRRALGPHRGRATLGLVPTMGALHDGHVALFREARRACNVIVASIFVNPAQFNETTDLAAYPRDIASDAAICAAAGVDHVFAPSAAEMYPDGFATWIEPAGAAVGFEADWRPGHFRGVATVCLKLFTIVQPHIAFFGQKDAQQAAVVRQMVRDLNLPMEIRVIPTVRASDGLALSSRNARLSEEERIQARAVPRAIEAAQAAHRQGSDPVQAARAALNGLDVQYVDVTRLDGRNTLVIAVRVGSTRLIDNTPLDSAPLVGARS
ncbi:MAG: pantoate--beta-alanine ligase [Vicinamibacterales bacterium]